MDQQRRPALTPLAQASLGLVLGFVLLPACVHGQARSHHPAAAVPDHAAPAAKVDHASQLLRRWRVLRRDSRWQSPLPQEREALADAMPQLFAWAKAGCPTWARARLRAQLRPAGFQLRGPTQAVVHVHERKGRRRGGAFYLLRCGPSQPLLLQAPHGIYDLHTGELALRLFAAHPVRAVFINTVHRYRSQPGEGRQDPVHPADVAHQYGSFFHAATLAAAAADARLRVVQLHGFDGASHAGDVMLSSGQTQHPPRRIARALTAMELDVRLFGVDKAVLGATRNVQQRALNRTRAQRFLHVEMSLTLRRQLRDDAALRARWWRALSEPWW